MLKSDIFVLLWYAFMVSLKYVRQLSSHLLTVQVTEDNEAELAAAQTPRLSRSEQQQQQQQ